MSSLFGSRRSQSEEQEELHPTKITIQDAPVGFDTVLGAECTMEGKLSSSGNIRLNGKFTGDLDITGNILVGETAVIEADIHAENISIAGTVRGNVSGKKVQLLQSGRIWGDISAASLTTEEGAFIDGKITMLGHAATRPPTAEELTEHAEATVDDESDDDNNNGSADIDFDNGDGDDD